MGQIVLKQEIVDKIKTDAELFGKVATVLDISPLSLPRLLYANDIKLTQAGVLRILCEHLGEIQDSNLLTEMQEA